MAGQKSAWDYIGDLFDTLSSQDSLKAQAATSAQSSGAAFYQKKDYTRAANEFKRAISLDPTNAQSYKLLASTYLAQNKFDDAIKTYRNSLSLDPTQDSIHTSLGNIYLQQKKYNQAETEFKAAIKLNPTDTLAPYTLGQLYLQTNRYADAETQFKKVERMAPSDPNPYYSLGATYNKEGNYTDAVKQLTQAIKLRPKMAPAHFELGIAYAALGQTADAQAEVNTLSGLDANQGALLQETIAQPKIITAGGNETDNFGYALGAGTSLLGMLGVDSTTGQPLQSKEFSLTFYFDSDMDPSSIMDPSNWTISKASGGAAGYYNNLLPVVPTEAYIPQNPTYVVYDSENRSATVNFLLTQNSTNTATIDPSHMVFKFSGKDVNGKVMDPTADEFDGAAQSSF